MLRLNSVSVSVILVIVLGTYLISPDVQSYLNQRRQIVEMQESIQQAKDEVQDMQAERDRWQDPVISGLKQETGSTTFYPAKYPIWLWTPRA
jgi:cell division protein FtsB